MVTPRTGPSRAALLRNAWALLIFLGAVAGRAALGASATISSPETAPSTQHSTESPAATTPAEAESGTTETTTVQTLPAEASSPEPGEPTPRREVPDYRQLEPEPTSAGDVLIWVPRVLLIPAYLVTEYALRVPVGAAATEAERSNWPARSTTSSPSHRITREASSRPSRSTPGFGPASASTSGGTTPSWPATPSVPTRRGVARTGSGPRSATATGSRRRRHRLPGRMAASSRPGLLRDRLGDAGHLPLALRHRPGRGAPRLHPCSPTRAARRGPATDSPHRLPRLELLRRSFAR